jgi:2-polyprenyl-3-methyl-5-hydroxy-6-metoxy-1,4-benzoquinol methylase
MTEPAEKTALDQPTQSASELLEACLAKPDYHEQWIRGYRVPENERFFEEAFDYICHKVAAPRGATFLDAGCGTCAHAVRLAKRGYRVEAVDFSTEILSKAAAHVRGSGYADRITIGRENLLGLSFEAERFSYALCWGVLMHIPDVERAIAELARVLKDGGALILSEGNAHSLQSALLNGLRFVTRRAKATVRKTPSGTEYWTQSPAGVLVTREMNMPWLIDYAASQGLVLTTRVAGQFTELYARVSSPKLKQAIHRLNHAWFNYIHWPGPAYANLLIFRKQAAKTS